MKKIKIILIIIIACIGAIIIYNKFYEPKIVEPEIHKSLVEYTLLDEKNIYEVKNIDEIINILNNKTGIILFCNPGSSWCQYYIKALNDVAISNNIENIYYNDIKEDRTNNSLKYRKIIDKLNDYLYTDDTGNKRLNMPDLVFVRDGKVIVNDNSYTTVNSEIDVKEYWSDEKNVQEFNNQINEYIYLLNEEE